MECRSVPITVTSAVYLADIRTADLGACWTGNVPKTRDTATMSLSACRAPASGGVRSVTDRPAGFQGDIGVGAIAPIFNAARSKVTKAKNSLGTAREALVEAGVKLDGCWRVKVKKGSNDAVKYARPTLT